MQSERKRYYFNVIVNFDDPVDCPHVDVGFVPSNNSDELIRILDLFPGDIVTNSSRLRVSHGPLIESENQALFSGFVPERATEVFDQIIRSDEIGRPAILILDALLRNFSFNEVRLFDGIWSIRYICDEDGLVVRSPEILVLCSEIIGIEDYDRYYPLILLNDNNKDLSWPAIIERFKRRTRAKINLFKKNLSLF